MPKGFMQILQQSISSWRPSQWKLWRVKWRVPRNVRSESSCALCSGSWHGRASRGKVVTVSSQFSAWYGVTFQIWIVIMSSGRRRHAGPMRKIALSLPAEALFDIILTITVCFLEKIHIILALLNYLTLELTFPLSSHLRGAMQT